MIKNTANSEGVGTKYFEPCYRQGMCFPIKNKYLLLLEWIIVYNYTFFTNLFSYLDGTLGRSGTVSQKFSQEELYRKYFATAVPLRPSVPTK